MVPAHSQMYLTSYILAIIDASRLPRRMRAPSRTPGHLDVGWVVLNHSMQQVSQSLAHIKLQRDLGFEMWSAGTLAHADGCIGLHVCCLGTV